MPSSTLPKEPEFVVQVGAVSTLINPVAEVAVTHSADLYFGVYPGSLTGIRSNMYLSEWQITKGVGKYTSNFTPPSGAFLT